MSSNPALDISKIKNKVVRGQLLAKQKREKAQAKLKKRIARKEAEQRGEVVERGWTRTIENTREWLGDDEEWSDPRTRPAKVEVDEETGDVKVDLGTLANLFPAQPEPSTSDSPRPAEPKILITTSPGKPPSPFSKDFCEDLQALLGGKGRADIVPRRSPKFELGKVARWARGRGYGAIAVVGEDHATPTTLTLSLLPHGPTAHFRLTGITLGKHIKNHAKATSHPPELVLNHFSTPLGLSLASLLSNLFLPPSKQEVLERQGYAGRQVVLAQNSRDFVFIRRYRYMFALKSDRLGSKKKVGLERQQPEEDADEVIKARFQEIGPRMTIKMRWIKRGGLGETGDERAAREKEEEEQGISPSFGEGAGDDEDVDMDAGEVGGKGEEGEDDEEEEMKAAAKAIGLHEGDDAGQPNFDFAGAAAAAETEAEASAAGGEASTSEVPARPAKRPRTTPRKRKKPYHALLRPPPSPSPPPGYQDSEPIPLPDKKGKNKEQSLLSTVGKTWHAGKGEGGVREKKKAREWGWEAKMQVSRRKFFL
ncbi:aminoacyl-tRNA ligase [Pseudohyphozyma bogoriensis]|nr:aminoacyl-tRNA ligase [Pseudohyphozyma bogoriensis]